LRALASVPGSARYVVWPGLRRDEFLRHPAVIDGGTGEWWRPVGVGSRSG
jgi:hypothetical protein